MYLEYLLSINIAFPKLNDIYIYIYTLILVFQSIPVVTIEESLTKGSL